MIISFILTLFRKISRERRDDSVWPCRKRSRQARTRHLAAGMKNVLESGNPSPYVNLRWETDVYHPYLSQLSSRRTIRHATPSQLPRSPFIRRVRPHANRSIPRCRSQISIWRTAPKRCVSHAIQQLSSRIFIQWPWMHLRTLINTRCLERA